MRRFKWRRFIYNGYEPDNYMWIEGNENEDGIVEPDNFLFSGRFNDGYMSLEIIRLSSGEFQHTLDDKITLCETLEIALSITPFFLISPDHFEDGPLIPVLNLD